jgi:Mg-chelatase subunit ChlD
MRMRKSFLGGVVFAALLGLSCDSTVGLDPSQTSFTNLVVPGACKASDNLSRVEFSVMLLGGTEALLPDSDIAREPVTDLLDLNGFQFRLTQDDRGTIEQTSVVVDCDLCGPSSLGTMTKQGVGLRVTDFNFHYSGGEDRRGKRKLIIFMLDHSGSLVGVNPMDDTDVKPGRGSDRDDQRISFFLQLVGNLPADHYMSLVSFNGDFANISDQYSTPTVNRDVIREGLEKLNFNEAGKTPLARALDDVYERIIVPNYEDLNPVVVLFTDGAEARDDSGNLGDAMAKYASGPASAANGQPSAAAGQQVPIVVMHLQQTGAAEQDFGYPRGRSIDYQDLACKSGGEYLFLERASEFTESTTLQSVVRNRLAGVWRLSTETTLSNPDFEAESGFLMSTELTVTLGVKSRSFSMSRERQSDDVFNDTRIWLYKQ